MFGCAVFWYRSLSVGCVLLDTGLKLGGSGFGLLLVGLGLVRNPDGSFLVVPDGRGNTKLVLVLPDG